MKGTKERAGKIEYYKWAIAACEKQKKLYTNEEANEARRNFINVYNEGGEGFVPHFYTIDEYEEAKRKLEVLEVTVHRPTLSLGKMLNFKKIFCG